MAILAGVLLAGSLFMGAFSFAGSSEAACGGRLPYRSCGWDRHETKTITRTLTISTIDAQLPE